MKKIITLLMMIGFAGIASASVYPVANADIVIKKNEGGRVQIFQVGSNGIFHAVGLDAGTYDIYIYDQAQDPIATKVPSQNGEISGRLMLQIQDSNIEDNTKLQPKVNNYFKGVWDPSKLDYLKTILKNEGIQSLNFTATDVKKLTKDVKDVLKTFQTKHHLKVDGTLGASTLKKLNDIYDQDNMFKGL